LLYVDERRLNSYLEQILSNPAKKTTIRLAVKAAMLGAVERTTEQTQSEPTVYEKIQTCIATKVVLPKVELPVNGGPRDIAMWVSDPSEDLIARFSV
jgi:hypothetical protein